MIDLHSHTNKSDGTLTPTQIVDLAAEKGLSILAITDHDTIEGIQEAIDRAHAINTDPSSAVKAPKIIPGIEFSTEWNGRDVHVVGLSIDHNNASFVSRLDAFLI